MPACFASELSVYMHVSLLSCPCTCMFPFALFLHENMCAILYTSIFDVDYNTQCIAG